MNCNFPAAATMPSWSVKVFHDDEEVAKKLRELIDEKKNPIDDRILQGFITRIARIDRLLAYIGIQDAIRAGFGQKKIQEANQELSKGDAEASEGELDKAI